MRALLFRKLLRGLERHTPDRLISLEIQILLNTTARAFGTRGRSVWHHAPGRALREYADFTVRCMRRPEEDTARVNGKLYAEAYRTGRAVRRITGFRKQEDIEALVFYLYRNIRINMKGNIPGELTVSDCYFSKEYTPAQCALMSAVDSGIIAGISGGGNLTFRERLTEGCSRCRARFTSVLQAERTPEAFLNFSLKDFG